MKKTMISFLMLFALILSACSSTPESSTTSQVNTISRESIEEIDSAIEAAVSFYSCTVSTREDAGLIDITMVVDGFVVPFTFADCVVLVTDTAREAIDEHEALLGQLKISGMLQKDGKELMLQWTSTDFDNGHLVDMLNSYIADISLDEFIAYYEYEK